MRPSESNNSKTPEHDDMHLWLCDKENQTYLIKTISEKDSSLKELSQPKPYGIYKLGDTSYNFSDETAAEISGFGTDIKIEQLEIEVPVYTGYNSSYLQGVCDAILTWNSYRIRLYKIHKIVHNKNGEGQLRPDDAPEIFCKRCYEAALEKYNNKTDRWNTYTIEREARKEAQHKKTYDIDKSAEKKYGAADDRIGYSGLIIEFKPKLNSISGVIGQIKTYKDSFSKNGKYRTCKLYPVIITYDQNKKYDSILENQGIYIIRIKTFEEYQNQQRKGSPDNSKPLILSDILGDYK